jgi:hypothetical protein
MYHPQRIARLLQVGEPEIPAQVLRIDLIANPESQRFTPGHDLASDQQLQRTLPMLQPHFADAVLIVKVGIAVDQRKVLVQAAGLIRV